MDFSKNICVFHLVELCVYITKYSTSHMYHDVLQTLKYASLITSRYVSWSPRDSRFLYCSKKVGLFFWRLLVHS